MKQLILLLSLVFSLSVSAQIGQSSFPTLDDNPVWSVMEGAFSPGIRYYEYEDDTVFCGQQYFKVSAENENVGYG